MLGCVRCKTAGPALETGSARTPPPLSCKAAAHDGGPNSTPAAAAGTMPTARYQHGAVFVGARLHISGGAVGGGRMVDDASSIVVLDTAAGTWCLQADPPASSSGDGGPDSEKGGGGSGGDGENRENAPPGPDDWLRRCASAALGASCERRASPAECRHFGGWPEHAGWGSQGTGLQASMCCPGSSRCRHAVAAVGPYVFIYGGLRGSALLDDFLLADDSSGSELSICDPRSNAWCAPAATAAAPASPCCAHCSSAGCRNWEEQASAA